MATKAKIAKAKKREELVAKYAELRAQLKAQGDYQALASFLGMLVQCGCITGMP